MAEMIGKRYVVIKLIGEGGMADVYLAFDTILKREVAIKVLRGELNNDPVNLRRFQREASAITNLSHPNIVEVYDVGEENGRNYIVMEYVSGKTLKQLVKSRGAMQADEAVNIMKQLVSATAHAHANGIIHRDIKSQNVMIKDDGTVKLSDFGIAFTKDSQQLTQTDTVMGSVHYLSPELAKGQVATVQSDIYSLGVVFFEMLTGDVPFHGETAVQIALKHMHDEIPSVRLFNPEIPQAVENIIIRATAKNKDKRYGSADEMYNDLVTCLDFSRIHEAKLVISDKKNNGPQISTEVRKVKRKKNRITADTVLACLAAVTLCITIIFMIMVLGGRVQPEIEKNEVPNLISYSLDDALRILENRKITVGSIVYEPTEDVVKGKVIKTVPAAGSEMVESDTIVIYVSSGTYFTVEDYTGRDINIIKPMLESNGFDVIVATVVNRNYKPGSIIDQSVAAGIRLAPSDTRVINLTVAEEVSFLIPTNLQGMNITEAKNRLEKLGAEVSLVQLPIEENMDVETGEYINPLNTVISVEPAMGTFYVQTEGAVIVLKYY
ncbi:MAG: Stk1 family PASTA domain-containing Ser/Thr kinase [Erysipelotrichaceae bacterium]|nr:Stk1 family PASTA domain-containing Ser/Thr kinase [Erysipelotrichaceae bacterium]MBQ4253144.1 Stk1 family PASTA domain-containing Ser/Thr kinase [Erysipelotrichaceae bacterium]